MDTDLATALPALAPFVDRESVSASQMLFAVRDAAVLAQFRAEVTRSTKANGSVSVRVPGLAQKLTAWVEFTELDDAVTVVNVRAEHDNAGQVVRALDPKARLYAASPSYALFVGGNVVVMQTNGMVVGRNSDTGQLEVTVVGAAKKE